MSVVHDQVFGARTPNYKVLQQLDRKVRDFYTPPSLQVPGFGGAMADLDAVPVYLTLQRYVGFAIREMSKLVPAWRVKCILTPPKLCFTCTADFLRAPSRIALTTLLVASMPPLCWQYITVHAPSLD